MKIIYVNCGLKNYMKEDHRSYIRNFCSFEKKALFAPLTSAIPVQSSHWLPMEQRIIFKLILTPQYLSSLLTLYAPTRSLRSATKNRRSITRSNLSTYINGDRAFSIAASWLWNQLPNHIRTQVLLRNLRLIYVILFFFIIMIIIIIFIIIIFNFR